MTDRGGVIVIKAPTATLFAALAILSVSALTPVSASGHSRSDDEERSIEESLANGPSPSENRHYLNADEEVPDPELALAADAEIVARSLGWSVDDARAFLARSDEFIQLMQDVRSLAPEHWAGADAGESIQATPEIWLKGEAPQPVRELLDRWSSSVELVDGLPYSLAELDASAEELHRSLVEEGLTEIGVHSDPLAGEIVVALAGASASELAISRDRADAVLRSETFLPVRLELVETPRAAVPYHIRGGMRSKNVLGQDCTTGFGVRSEQAFDGVMTAGHCLTTDVVLHGSTTHFVADKGGHEGSWGDFRWFSSSTSELASFYVSSSTARDVRHVAHQNDHAKNLIYCYYGRTSNVQECGRTRHSSLVTCVNWGRQIILAPLSGNGKFAARRGDSGGPLFTGHRAVGVMTGGCSIWGPWDLAFSHVDLIDEVLNVRVMSLDRVVPWDVLGSGQSLLSPDGRFRLRMQTDGNLVLFRVSDGHVLWDSGSWGNPGAVAFMQNDGNFVVVAPGNIPVFDTGTGTTNSIIRLQSDGNLVVYNNSQIPLWASNTGGN